ncbi:transcription termination factor MTEF18, mitochondrial [Morus notabilis]|uniref:transcription termination factor MTEF18, mitochondrial n=1 Tax=Morus notabilis TaxID=981085 RepID=UPI000CED06B4|nr:transcription termination factor MTEF18, mitochondrial [Morus notabilis]
MPLPKSLFTFLSRNFSSSSYAAAAAARKLPVIRGTNNIHPIHKLRALKEAQKALTDYLHDTRGLPFIFAEQIAANSFFALSDLIRKIRFSAFTFSESFESLLRYHPVNEFEFFLESIGIDRQDVHLFLPKNTFFFSEDSNVLDASLELIQFGFPWNKLGVLYREEVSIFSMSGDELTDRLNGFKERFGYDNLCVVGVCLAFPYLLSVEGQSGGCIEAVFEDLEMVFQNFELARSCVEENVDTWYELCRKVRVFYDLGCKKGKVGELMCKRKELIFPSTLMCWGETKWKIYLM